MQTEKPLEPKQLFSDRDILLISFCFFALHAGCVLLVSAVAFSCFVPRMAFEVIRLHIAHFAPRHEGMTCIW